LPRCFEIAPHPVADDRQYNRFPFIAKGGATVLFLLAKPPGAKQKQRTQGDPARAKQRLVAVAIVTFATAGR
jgi:hypothetical protein